MSLTAQLNDIHALAAALKQLDSPSEELIERVQQVGQDLSQHQVDARGCDSLYDFLEELEESEKSSEYHQLYDLYQQEISYFGEQEKNKGKPISGNSSLPPIRSAGNAAAEIDYLVSYNPLSSRSNQENSSEVNEAKKLQSHDNRLSAEEAEFRGLGH